MKQLQNLEAAQATFLEFSPLDMKGKYQLDRMISLMDFLGNPQNTLKVIHIAGTSGKTSTAYFIRGMLEAAGKRTGLTISPHITGINERVQIDGKPLDEQHFLNYVNRFFVLIEQSGLQPTYFELLIALAYWVFAEEKVDYAVIETGLGGLLDGTNVVNQENKVCVITDIGLDHTEILGETIQEIARQKAGIIQPYNQVFMLEQAAEVVEIMRQTAKRRRAVLEVIRVKSTLEGLPVFQKRNWLLAEAVLKYLQRRDGFQKPHQSDLQAVMRQSPPGRWEIYKYKGKTIIIDGAHNPQELEALVSSLGEHGITSAAVLANFKQAPKAKIEASLQVLRPIVAHLIIPEFSAGQDLKNLRSVQAAELATLATYLGFESIETKFDIKDALKTFLECPEETLIITGSLYLVGAIRPLLDFEKQKGRLG